MKVSGSTGLGKVEEKVEENRLYMKRDKQLIKSCSVTLNHSVKEYLRGGSLEDKS
jgi:hypothetical protein